MPALGGMVVASATCEVVLGQVLAAHKDGNLDALLPRRPRATRWFLRRLVAQARAAAGDAFASVPSPCAALQVLQAWALAQLRPR